MVDSYDPGASTGADQIQLSGSTQFLGRSRREARLDFEEMVKKWIGEGRLRAVSLIMSDGYGNVIG